LNAPHPDSIPKLAIVVFAYNEQENVGAVLKELTLWLDTHEPSHEIIFVDDGSNDATAANARSVLGPGHTVIQHASNRGIGAALKTGVAAARAAWVTFLPADGQIEPAAIGTLRADCENVDVVLSVYADRNDGMDRALLSWGVRSLIRVIHGVRMQSDGPYLFRRTLFLAEQLPSDTFFLNMEFPIRVMRAGLRTRVVTIRCRPRRSGASKSAKLAVIRGVTIDLLNLKVRRTREALRQLL
jgi:glycosyltransferase involved in cell wall biosynthesis